MARDKQIVVRVTDELRADFQFFCEREDVTASKVLADMIEHLCQGSLSLDVALGRSESPALAMEGVEDLIEQRLEATLSEWLASSQLADQIEAIVAAKLGAVESNTQRAISQAMEDVKSQWVSQALPELGSDTGEEVLIVQSNAKTKKAFEVDLSTYDPQKGFTGTELAKAIGLKSSSSVADAVREGRFADWSKDKDPDGCPWYCRGEGTARRFFRGEGN